MRKEVLLVGLIASIFLIGCFQTPTTPKPLCGNGVIESGETCRTCPADVGECAETLNPPEFPAVTEGDEGTPPKIPF
ncbi:MAG: hypothetical protein ABIE23_05560 [archaeon]|nr:hypothetical protein [Candidatus Micrarchaeota archaeon]